MFDDQVDVLKKLLESCPPLKGMDAALSSKGGDPFADPNSILLKRELVRVSTMGYPFELEEEKYKYWLEKLDGRHLIPNELPHGVQDIDASSISFEDYGNVLSPGAIVKMSVLLSAYVIRGREQEATAIYAKLDPLQVRVLANGEIAKSLKPGRAVRL